MMCWFNKHFQLCSHHAHHNNKHRVTEQSWILLLAVYFLGVCEQMRDYRILLDWKMYQEILSNTGYFIPAGGSSTPRCIYRAAENMHDQLISCSVPSCADWEAWCTGGKPMWFLREPVNRIKNEVGRRSLNWSFTSQLQQHLKGHFHEDVIPKLDAFSSQKNTCFFWRIQKKPVHHL